MNKNAWQKTVRQPRTKGGRWTVTYKVAGAQGQLRILGSGLTLRDAEDQAERAARAQVDPEHKVFDHFKRKGLDSRDDPVPF